MQNPSRDEFADLVAERLSHESLSEGQVSFDAPSFSLIFKNEHGSVVRKILLSTYYSDYCNETDVIARENILALAARNPNNVPIPDTYEEMKDRIYPHIVDRWTLEEQRLAIQLGLFGDGTLDVRFPCAAVAQSFAGVLAYDLPDTRSIINSTQTDQWTVPFESAFGEAVARLAERSVCEFEMLKGEEAGSGAYFSIWNDGYDAARIFFDQLIRSFPVKGDHVVFIPTSDRLMFTGSDDDLGLAIGIAEFQRAATEAPKPLPPIAVLVGKDSTLREFTPPPEHPLFQSFKRCKSLYFNRIYESQRNLLHQTPEALNGEIFVAKYIAFANKEGKVASQCTLTEGVTTLLPKTDYISFVRVTGERGETLASGNWERVFEICPELIESADLYPPRYRVTQFPTAQQLEKIGLEDPFQDLA